MRHQQQSASNFSHLVEAGTVPRGGAGAAVNVGVAAAVGVGVAAAAAAAGTVPDSQYETLAQGAAGCGPGKTITTEAECRAAHDALDLTIDPPWIGSHGGIPVGCSTRGYSYRMHWNSASSGRARSDMTPVCATCRVLNQDVVAGTFEHFGADGTGANSDGECSERCNQQAECTAWVRQPSTGNCWLTSQAVVTFEANSDRNTGLRGC